MTEINERKNAEGYPDPTAFAAVRACDRPHFAYRPVIYVCSPFSGDIEGNTARAKTYSRFVVDQGGIPLTPHLLFPQFMDEEKERDLAIFMDMVILSKCAELWAFGDEISSGMQREIKRAKWKGIPVRFIRQEEMQCTK